MKCEGLKVLERLAMERKRLFFPNVPEHCVPKSKYSDGNTNDLQTAIIDYIDFTGGWATRVNTQGQYVEKLQRHIPSSTKKGTPDIIGCLPGGVFISIECKRDPYDKLSDVQEKVRDDIKAAGGLHLVAHVGQFDKVFQTINNNNQRTNEQSNSNGKSWQ
jgi:hypothetical protein